MDELDRMYRLLVERLRAELGPDSPPDALERPLRIDELYTRVIPYRLYRRELAIDTNEDYEATLLRLLAGERGYVTGDERMQRVLAEEARASNPDTTLYREFATNSVRVRAVAAGAARQGPPELPPPPVRTTAPSVPPFAPVADLPAIDPEFTTTAPRPKAVLPPEPSAVEPASVPARPDPSRARQVDVAPDPVATPETPAVIEIGIVPRESGTGSRPHPTAPSASSAPSVQPPDQLVPSKTVTAEDVGGSCRYCSHHLPSGRRFVFCPYCGQNLTVRQCPACSTELELDWKFCVTCGRSAAGAAPVG